MIERNLINRGSMKKLSGNNGLPNYQKSLKEKSKINKRDLSIAVRKTISLPYTMLVTVVTLISSSFYWSTEAMLINVLKMESHVST